MIHWRPNKKLMTKQCRVLTQPVGRAFAAARQLDAESALMDDFILSLKTELAGANTCISGAVSYIASVVSSSEIQEDALP
jgi:hypothetical protein